jgi:pimeloyl-ACP methyl ester carboxylesterase
VRWPHLGLLLLAVVGCATPSDEFGRRVSALHLAREVVHGDPFDHLIVRAPARRGPHLHVYLEGDGTPWIGGLPARDPTPRRPLALALMASDPAPSLYLGRPCYHGIPNRACTSRLWTAERYTEAVVASMEAAIKRIVAVENIEQIVWIGYSGGGSLAVLLAQRLRESTGVVTVAANLDIDAWTDWHGDPRLVGSLNPAREPPLLDRIVQIHYAGGRDRLVPVDIVRRGMRGGRLVVEPLFDHVCCWEQAWPTILDEVARAIPSRSAER